jgi:hypothetical protein
MTREKMVIELLDIAGGVAYDALMTNDELIQRAADMKRLNAAAKRTIQTKRTRDARTIASTKGIDHAKFPTYYKYG